MSRRIEPSGMASVPHLIRTAVLALTAGVLVLSWSHAQGLGGGVFVAGTDIAFKDLRWQSWAGSTYFMTLYNTVAADPAQNPNNLVMPTMYGGPTTGGGVGQNHDPLLQGPQWECQFFGNPPVAGTGRLFYNYGGAGLEVEGKGSGIAGNIPQFYVNRWFRTLQRAYNPTPDEPEYGRKGYLGFWFKDLTNGLWYYGGSFDMGCPTTGLSGFGRWTTLEWLGGIAAIESRIDTRWCYGRAGTQWYKINKVDPAANRAVLENNTVDRLGNPLDATALTTTAWLDMPDQPPFDPIVINNAAAIAYGNQVWVTWEIPTTSSPQFGYKIELFGGPNATGTLLQTKTQNAPFIYGRRLTASAAVQSVRLTIIDVMDQSQAVVLPVQAGTLNGAVSTGAVMPGLRFEMYTGAWTQLPGFSGLTPARRGYLANVSTKPLADQNAGTCATRYFGYLNAPADGLYMLQVGTRDGFRLTIDGTVVRTDDGQHPAVLNAIPLALGQGRHGFLLEHIVSPGVANRADTICQDLRWSGPGFDLQPIENSAFTCDDPGGVPTLAISVASPAVANGTIADNQAEVHVAVGSLGTHTVKEIGLYGAGLCIKYTGTLAANEAAFNVLLPRGTNTYSARMLCDNGANYYETRSNLTLTVQERHDPGPWTFEHSDWGSSFVLPGSSRYDGSAVSFMGQGDYSAGRVVNSDMYTITARIADCHTADIYPTTPEAHLGLFTNNGAADYRFFLRSSGEWRTCPNFYDFGGGTISTPLPNSEAMKSNRWMRLTQTGKRCAAYSSADGTTWVKLSDWLGENFASGSHKVGSFLTGAVRDESQKPAAYGKVADFTVDTGSGITDPAPPQPLAAELALTNRITGVVQCFGSPDTMYARSPTRGVLRSTDHGNTWREVNNGLTGNPAAMAVRSVAVHPAQPNVVLRAGGALVGGHLSSGLWKSTDSGNTWSLVTTAIDFDGTGPTTLFGETVMFSRGVPGTVIAAGESKLVFSTDSGSTWPDITDNACGGQRISSVNFGPYSPSPDWWFAGTFADSQLAALGLPAPNVSVSNPGSGGVYSGLTNGARYTNLSMPDFGVATIHEGSYSSMIDLATTRGEYYTGFGPFPLNMAIPSNRFYVALSDEDYRFNANPSPFLIRTAPFSSANDNRIWQGVDRSEWTDNWAALGDPTSGSRLYHAPDGAYVCRGLTCLKCDAKDPKMLFFCNAYGIFKSTDGGANFTLMAHSEAGAGGTETYPFAAATATPASGTAPFEVTFDGSASYDDNGIVSYVWDFGDGTTGNGAIITHTYTRGGTCNPTLTVTDTVGQQATSALSAITVTGTYDLLSFALGGTSGVISGTKVTLVVPYGTNLTNVSPTCTVSSGATVSPVSGSPNNFTNPVNYTVTAADGIHTNVYTITVYVAPPPGQIRTVPPGMQGGEQYRLAFVTSGETYGWSGAAAGAFTGVAQYNTFAASAATAVPALNALNTTWKAIVATYANGAAISAPANTLTRTTDPSVPVYNLDGAMVAQGNSDLWDGSISSPISRTETGTVPSAQRGNETTVWTGMYPAPNLGGAGGDYSLVTPSGGYIYCGNATATNGAWASTLGTSDPNARKSDAQPIYVISGILIVPRTGCDLLTFQWGSNIGVINGGNVTLTVPYGTDLTNMNPVCTVSPGATVLPASGVSNNFTGAVDYTVTAEDGQHSKVYHVTVAVAPPSAACDLLTFAWGSCTATISGTNVSLTVPYGTNVAALSPTCTISPLATVSPVSGSSNNFMGPVNYTVTAQDGVHSRTYRMIVTVTPPSTACDMLAFGLASNNASIGGTSVTLTVPFGTDVTALSPTCTISPLATVSPASGSPNNFTGPVNYTVTAQDGTTSKTYTVTVVVEPDPNQIITIPPALSPGSQYCLVFVTSSETYGRANAGGGTGPAGISAFNAFATTCAGAVPKLAALGTTWKAVVSVRNADGSTVDARTNTGTGSGTGVPIYNLGGLLVAGGYTQLWGSALTNPINVTELGTAPGAQRDGYFMVHTGMTDNGGASGDWSLCYPTGGYAFAGNPTLTSINTSNNSPPSWCSQFGQADPNQYSYDQMPIYVMSGILTVPTVPQIVTLTWGSSTGVIDQNAKTIALTVPYGTDLSTLNPTCTVTAGATVSPASGAVPSPNFATLNPRTYTVSAGGLQTIYNVTVAVAPVSHACDMLTFGLGANSAVISGTSVTLTVPYGTTVTSLTPTCTLSPGASVAPASGTSRDFTNPQSYTVTAQDGTSSKTYTVSVVVAPDPNQLVTVPPGLSPGNQYRLLFVTSGETYGWSGAGGGAFTTTSQYNDFAAAAAAAVPALNALNTTWKAVVATKVGGTITSAPANTGTASGTGVAFYNLYGQRVADNNSDLWDSTLQNPINRTETGAAPAAQRNNDILVWTGMTDSAGNGNGDWSLIAPSGGYIRAGKPNATDGTWASCYGSGDPNTYKGDAMPIYVMSGVLTVSATVAQAPAITSITSGNGTLSVAFTAPSSNGGAAITNYKVSTNGGSTYTAVSPASTSSPLVISGLTNGTSYTVRIRAVNSVGDGVPSNSVSGTPLNGYALWAAANAGGQAANLDSNKNGIPNGIEFFMGATAAKPATMPVVVTANGVLTWTWPYDPAAGVTYKFQLSDDMTNWADVAPPDSRIGVLTSPDRIRFTLPTGVGKRFCRLVVTPNP